MTFNSPFAAIAPSKKPLDTVSRGQLVSRGLMGGGGCSSWALGSTSGTYKIKKKLSVVNDGGKLRHLKSILATCCIDTSKNIFQA